MRRTKKPHSSCYDKLKRAVSVGFAEQRLIKNHSSKVTSVIRTTLQTTTKKSTAQQPSGHTVQVSCLQDNPSSSVTITMQATKGNTTAKSMAAPCCTQTEVKPVQLRRGILFRGSYCVMINRHHEGYTCWTEESELEQVPVRKTIRECLHASTTHQSQQVCWGR